MGEKVLAKKFGFIQNLHEFERIRAIWNYFLWVYSCSGVQMEWNILLCLVCRIEPLLRHQNLVQKGGGTGSGRGGQWTVGGWWRWWSEASRLTRGDMSVIQKTKILSLDQWNIVSDQELDSPDRNFLDITSGYNACQDRITMFPKIPPDRNFG